MSGLEVALVAEGLDPARGGAERAIRALAAALAAGGRRVALYAPAERLGPPAVAAVELVGVEVASAPRPIWALRAARALAERARADGAQRVIACGKLLGADAYWPHGGVQAASRRASVATRPTFARRALARIGRRLRASEWSYDLIERRAFGACARGESVAVALSDRVRNDMQRHHGIDPARVRVVHNGVDSAEFSPPSGAERGEARRSLAKRIAARGDASIALFVGHAFDLKGLDTAIRAVGPVPGVHLAVVGCGKPQPYLQLAASAGLQGRLTFLGRVSDMQRIYRGASFLLHPSRYDPCSLVVLEALACGLPVVASGADGASELVRQGQNGYVVPDCEDWSAFAATVEHVDDPKLRATLAEGAASFRRTWSDVARELLATLNP